MPSQARQYLADRLVDVDQILQAHTALTKFKRAEAVANQAGGGLQSIINVVNALVTDPGQGRPAEVAALNRSAFVLLCAHFQGFVEDLHREAAQCTLNGKVASIEDIVKLVKPRNSNPHADIIGRCFRALAFTT